MEIVLKSQITRDKFTDHVIEAYDIQNRDETIVKVPNNIHLDFDWSIGVIYGGSGTGKTTLLKAFGKLKEVNWSPEKSLVSNFDFMKPHEVPKLLSSMGLSSVPAWLRPFHTLSNGEQYRAHLAYQVAKAEEGEVILIDEFTSVVDRDVAKTMSDSLQRYVRRMNKKIILASCHFDIMDWLNPDWIYSPNKGHVERRDCLRLERPTIELEVFRCRYETWDLFKHHHYLTSALNPAAKCFLFLWHGKPCGLIAVLPFPHGHIKNGWRISRTVVLPDFQGIRIGSFISDYIAALYHADGKTMYAKTSNPALWNHFSKSKNWLLIDEVKRKDLNSVGILKNKDANFSGFRNAITSSYKWIGYKSTDNRDIINFNAEAYKNVSQAQQSLF